MIYLSLMGLSDLIKCCPQKRDFNERTEFQELKFVEVKINKLKPNQISRKKQTKKKKKKMAIFFFK